MAAVQLSTATAKSAPVYSARASSKPRTTSYGSNISELRVIWHVAQRISPVRVRAVPRYRFTQALVKHTRRLPAGFCLDFGRVDRISLVMARSRGHVRDQPVMSGAARPQLVGNRGDSTGDVVVGFLADSADVVALTNTTFAQECYQ